ncbi:MAG: type III pantothenate kinase [Schleiferiaceae bacterium]
MNFLFDAGNTRVRVGTFSEKGELSLQFFEDLDSLMELNFQSDDQLIYCSVRKDDQKVRDFVKSKGGLVVSHEISLPFSLDSYKTPQTLGADRIALVAGAQSRFPNSNVLVIDAGTCITYDFYSPKDGYGGGIISPGLAMRAKAMSSFTQALPEVKSPYFNEILGRSTEECLGAGVYVGITSEIDGIISQYKQRFGEVEVIFTGGDTELLVTPLKNNIFADPEILMKGLNAILDHYVEETRR